MKHFAYLCLDINQIIPPQLLFSQSFQVKHFQYSHQNFHPTEIQNMEKYYEKIIFSGQVSLNTIQKETTLP